VLDTATALDAIAGYEPGDHHHATELPISFVEAARRPPGPVPIRVALSAPLGVPIDGEPRDAARRTAHALADLGHDIRDEVPDWDDEAFPSSWETFATGALQHIIRVLERLHGRAVDPERLEPATRGWLIDSAPVPLVEYLEAAERLWAFCRRILSSWPEGSVLVTPTLTRLPATVGGLQSQAGVTDDAVRFSTLVRIWGVTGQPALSLPIHQTADGVPVGVQLIGPPGRDDLLLALAAQLEESVGWCPRAPADG
jgi:amidase